MVEIISIDHISSTEQTGDEHLNLTEFINNGLNGVLFRRYAEYNDNNKYHQAEMVKELQEAGMWIASSPTGHDYTSAEKSAVQEAGIWGADFLEIDEPYDIGTSGCFARDWLTNESIYQNMRTAIRKVNPSIKLIISDVHCNSVYNGWNIDGLAQEMYGSNMYPDFMNKVIDFRTTTGKPGYLWINLYTRQLYNKCLEQPESMFRQWVQGAWDNRLKIIYFNFSNRCATCLTHNECANMGNNWDEKKLIIKDITANSRVKFHEWKSFQVKDSTILTPDLSVEVRSGEAGLNPDSVKCYYTNEYKGRWSTDSTTETFWKETPCSCTGESDTKEWQTITASKVPLVIGTKNRVRFKIRDNYSGTYYRNARWSRQEYTVNMDANTSVKNILSNSMHEGDVEVLNLQGQRVLVLKGTYLPPHQLLRNNSYLARLKSGLYLVKMKKAGKIEIHKIIKE
ncbi:MAG: T9SS type A sorting domain-containing protein [Fibrobacteria bacterium]|nr:T9SS type A sorting domain-containing protein [Fibrobacteria bacterium]